jgi:hypothetical protein
VSPLMSAAFVFLLAVGAGLSKLLRPVTEMRWYQQRHDAVSFRELLVLQLELFCGVL